MDKEKVQFQEDPEERPEKEEESFKALFEEGASKISVGETVKGVVVKVTPDSVLLDIGYKSDGVVPVGEFRRPDGTMDIKVGDRITAVIERLEGKNGLVVLSRTKAAKMQIWEDIARLSEEGGFIEGRVTGKTKGGLFVDLGGVQAFLPGSQIDIKPVKNVDEFLGKTFHFKVLNYDRKAENVVVSRRGYIEALREKEREKTLGGLYEGAVVQGTVKNIMDYGAFVDIGGIDGLLHLNDISWRRIKHPSDVLRAGDWVTVKVLKLDIPNKKISLGMKQATRDPWEDASAKYPVGSRVRGKVVNLADFGAFVEVEEGVEGMIHVSDMSWTKKVRHPSSVLSVGDMVEAVVLDLVISARKMALGLKQTLPNPWDTLEERYPLGGRIKGKISSVTDFGVFVEVEEGIDGLVHLSDISWTKKIRHPSDLFKKGDDVEAVVLGIDKEKEKLSLGIKQLQRDPWLDVPSKYPKGSVVSGKVSSVTDFGVFLELEEGIEGLIRESDLIKEKEKKPPEVVKEGEILRAKVLSIDTAERKISLSVKAVEKDEEKAAIKEFFKKQGSGKASLGDILKEKLNNTGKE
jgi:small subunit ribosomal protein S1